VDDKIKENEMGWSCSTCGGEKECIWGFLKETGRKEITWKK